MNIYMCLWVSVNVDIMCVFICVSTSLKVSTTQNLLYHTTTEMINILKSQLATQLSICNDYRAAFEKFYAPTTCTYLHMYINIFTYRV